MERGRGGNQNIMRKGEAKKSLGTVLKEEEGGGVLLLDVCCGTGTIGLCCAKKMGVGLNVQGIELSQGAVNDAKVGRPTGVRGIYGWIDGWMDGLDFVSIIYLILCFSSLFFLVGGWIAYFIFFPFSFKSHLFIYLFLFWGVGAGEC